MASRETQRVSKIAAAVSGGVSIHSIVDDIIRPALREAIVVSESAHDAFVWAICMAKRG
jgi:DNA-binding transcriptional regulator YdaS (Cro superfamily)